MFPRLLAVLTLLAAGEAMAGSITGRVSDAGGAPLGGVRVSVCTTSTNCLPSTVSDADGRYRFDGLAAGSYVAAAAKLPYRTQYYDGIDCPCDQPTSATIISVTADGEAAGIDFSLTLGGTISGTVRHATTGAAIDGVRMIIAGASVVTATQTYNGGRYQSTGLPPGDYRVYTTARDSQHLINQVYPSRHCIERKTCTSGEIGQGQPVTVTAGNDVPAIDFSLLWWATISGTVHKSDGSPLRYMTVEFIDTTNGQQRGASTRENGAYTGAAPPGTYTVKVHPGHGYAGVIYPDTPCPTSNCTGGTPVRLTTTPVTGIDLVVQVTTARLQGTIRDRRGVPFAGVAVDAVAPSGYHAAGTTTDASGRYSFDALPPGRYYLKAVDELLPNVDCSGVCNVQGATPLDLAAGTTTTVDMQVRSERSTFSGRVTKGTPDGPPARLYTVAIFDEGGRPLDRSTSLQSSANGTYTLTFISRANAVHIAAYADDVHPTAYPAAPWTCPWRIFCPAPGAASIAPGTRTGIDFVMVPFGAISGTVYDRSTGKPVPSAPVTFTRNGEWAAQVQADAQGRYRWTKAYGTYQVYVPESLHGHYAGQVYPDRDCTSQCNPKAGTPVFVASEAETTGIDFRLTPLSQVQYGRISGTVRDAATGKPVTGAPVRFAQSGVDVALVTTGADGRYRWEKANGSYHVYVQQWGSDVYLGQVYPGRDCHGVCDSQIGSLVTAADGAARTNIDFHLNPAGQYGRISGQVVDDATGAGIPDVYVLAWNGAVYSAGTYTDARGHYTIEKNETGRPLPSGDYRMTADGAPYFVSVYGGAHCPEASGCDVDDGALVRVTAPHTTSGIDFRLVRARAATVTPASGPATGGTWVAIAGEHFAAGTKVRIGDADAEVVSVTPTRIVAITPPGPAGAADVTVTVAPARTATIVNGFVYTPGSSKRRSARH